VAVQHEELLDGLEDSVPVALHDLAEGVAQNSVVYHCTSLMVVEEEMAEEMVEAVQEDNFEVKNLAHQ